ncbi:MAG: tetratricopeptide repeat protein [Chlorobiales bacterium]|nr:tetratricopeptide repeat protein [Chlorobiales bacterium]
MKLQNQWHGYNLSAIPKTTESPAILSSEALFEMAFTFHQQGHLMKAEAHYREILLLQPNHFDALQLLATIVVQRKKSAEAVTLFDQVLTIDPHHSSSHNNRGLALKELMRYQEALQSYDMAIAVKPDYAEAYANRGVVLSDLKKYEESLASSDKALAIKPDYAEAYYNRGNALKELMRYEEALLSYERALAFKSGFAEAYFACGNVLAELKKYDVALLNYDKALAFRTNYAEAYYNRGNALKELKRYEEAVLSYDKAIVLKADYAEAYSNRGTVLEELTRYEEALLSYEKALAIKPDYAEAYSNRGNVLQELTRYEEALQSYDKALECLSEYAEAHWNQSLCYLVTGDFDKGFNKYEWRWKIKSTYFDKIRDFNAPLWLGNEVVEGKTILLHSEQGLGDTLQFCRYARLVADLGAKVILEVDKPLLNLLANVDGVFRIVSKGDPLPAYDFHCPLLSLPLAFTTKLETLPSLPQYLVANSDRLSYWKNRLGVEGFKIGISWQGSTGKVDKGRSFPLRQFKLISTIPGVRLVSLQKNHGTEQLQSMPYGMQVEILGDSFDAGSNAFMDSAAVIKNLDLVITSDTAIAHLSGALGCPTWVALKHHPDWRWLLDRSDSPWYPSMRLFRQKKTHDWDRLFNDVYEELISIVNRHFS